MEFFLKDIMKFLAIVIIFILAFVFSINNLYWYYVPKVRDAVKAKSNFDYMKEDGKDLVVKAGDRFGE
jgi:hypothetical protein